MTPGPEIEPRTHLVEGVRSHHCSNPAPHIESVKLESYINCLHPKKLPDVGSRVLAWVVRLTFKLVVIRDYKSAFDIVTLIYIP